jgi:hypothetical protein
MGGITVEGRKFHDMRREIAVNAEMPIFKEMSRWVGRFYIRVRDRQLGHKFAIGYVARAPGCLNEVYGYIDIGPSGQMHLKLPA